MTQEAPEQPKRDAERIICDDCGHEVVLVRKDGHYTLRCPCPRERTLVNVKPIPSGWLE
jgi:hypothetical protein